MECYSSNRGDTEGKFCDSVLSKILLTTLLHGDAELHVMDLFSPLQPPPNGFHLQHVGPEQKDEWKIVYFFKFTCLHIINRLGMKAQIWQKGAFINPVLYCCTFLPKVRKWRGTGRPEF